MPPLPPIELSTARLRLRALNEADTDACFAVFSDPEVVRYLGRPPSGRVLEKLGFRRQGDMPERWIVDGRTADTALYGLLLRYWNERA